MFRINRNILKYSLNINSLIIPQKIFLNRNIGKTREEFLYEHDMIILDKNNPNPNSKNTFKFSPEDRYVLDNINFKLKKINNDIEEFKESIKKMEKSISYIEKGEKIDKIVGFGFFGILFIGVGGYFILAYHYKTAYKK